MHDVPESLPTQVRLHSPSSVKIKHGNCSRRLPAVHPVIGVARKGPGVLSRVHTCFLGCA